MDNLKKRTPGTRIHSLERILLWVVGTHLVMLPWAFGTMHLVPQSFSLGLALLALAVSLTPRTYTAQESGAGSFRLLLWPKLIRFPVFWLGLFLLVYMTLQAINPSWIYQTDGNLFWMTEKRAISWLPVGVEVPFAKKGPWRMLMIYGSAWLTVCAMWVGFTRRRTLQLLLGTVAINGLFVALYGIIQRILGNGKIYWTYEFPGAVIFSTFVYKNHAGAYLFIILVIMVGFAGWFYLRGLRRMEKSNPG